MRRIAAWLLLGCLVAGFPGCSAPEDTSTDARTENESPPVSAAGHGNPDSGTPDGRPVIAAFGDSLTAGYGVSDADNYPTKLQARLDDRGYSYRVVNAGVSGDTTAQGLNRIQLILDLSPQVVILELGPNDGLRGLSLERSRQNLDEIIRRCQGAGARVILAGMTLPPNYGPRYIKTFEALYRDLSESYHTEYIPFFLEGVAARPELNLSDGLHPNGAGYDLVLENVWKALEPLLRK